MAYSGELRKNRIAAGLCGKCGKSPLFNNTECQQCRTIRSDYQKRAYRVNSTSKGWKKVKRVREERIAAGLCSRCGKEELTDNQHTCDKCLTRQRELFKNSKDTVYAAYGGYVCACCGETTPEFLTLDHVNNDGAKRRREDKTGFGHGLYRWIIRNNYPPIFQVLCYNCNCGKKHNGGVCPHEKYRLSEPSLQV
jgi:uncharacterized OB-fold protein